MYKCVRTRKFPQLWFLHNNVAPRHRFLNVSLFKMKYLVCWQNDQLIRLRSLGAATPKIRWSLHPSAFIQALNLDTYATRIWSPVINSKHEGWRPSSLFQRQLGAADLYCDTDVCASIPGKWISSRRHIEIRVFLLLFTDSRSPRHVFLLFSHYDAF